MDITIRAAQPEDLDELLGLLRELNADDPRLSTGAAGPVWAQIGAQQGRTVLVADAGDRLVGTVDCLVWPNLTRGARPVLMIENVVVSADYRRRGVGVQLLEAAIAIARSTGCYKAQLLADDPGAWSYYEAAGFTASARGYTRYFGSR